MKVQSSGSSSCLRGVGCMAGQKDKPKFRTCVCEGVRLCVDRLKTRFCGFLSGFCVLCFRLLACCEELFLEKRRLVLWFGSGVCCRGA